MSSWQLVSAAPGWRLAVVDHESESLEALPIVAWLLPHRYAESLEPFALIPGDQGRLAVQLWGGYEDRIVGIIPPGEEAGSGWLEAAEEVAKAIREQEEREASG